MIAGITNDEDFTETADSLARAVLSLKANIPFYSRMAHTALALVAVQRQDRAAAAEEYSALNGIPSIMLLYVSTDRVLGLLAQTMGNFELAIGHFEESQAFCRRADYRPELAWACHDHAGTLLQSGDPGDHDQAMLLLEESLAISEELGMRPLRERVARCLEQSKLSSVVVPAHPDGLTHRELEVLCLIAAGKSNLEIAEELVLSVRTVERHITSIYNKTNARNRVDATAYAFSHELSP